MLADELADEWDVDCRLAARPPCNLDDGVDVVLVGLSVDLHLAAVGDAVMKRGRSMVVFHVDAGPPPFEVGPGDPPARQVAGVFCRLVDHDRPIADHPRRRFVDPSGDNQEPGRGFRDSQRRAAVGGWLSGIDAARWVDHPEAARAANDKIAQLRSAEANGLRVPATLVSSDPEAIRRFAARFDAVVHKSLAHPLVDGAEGTASFLHTSELTAVCLRTLDAVGYPGLFQQRLDVVREYRVTVVGSNLTVVATDRQGRGVDWRRDIRDGVTFVRAELPAALADAVVSMTRGFGLVYATVDLVETADGDIWFLEINPSGAYLWLENQLGLSVTDQLVDELIGA